MEPMALRPVGYDSDFLAPICGDRHGTIMTQPWENLIIVSYFIERFIGFPLQSDFENLCSCVDARRIPEDYKNFLRAKNGGSPVENILTAPQSDQRLGLVGVLNPLTKPHNIVTPSVLGYTELRLGPCYANSSSRWHSIAIGTMRGGSGQSGDIMLHVSEGSNFGRVWLCKGSGVTSRTLADTHPDQVFDSFSHFCSRLRAPNIKEWTRRARREQHVFHDPRIKAQKKQDSIDWKSDDFLVSLEVMQEVLIRQAERIGIPVPGEVLEEHTRIA